MWDSLITFIIRYEYARALFDKRAALRFAGKASVLFQSLAKIELNHAFILEKYLPGRVVPLRSMFFQEEDYSTYDSRYLDGVSLNHVWARFLFKGKSASHYDLEDTLAFCAVAEKLENIGYSLLYFHPRFRSVCQKIVKEESYAEKRLINFLREETTLSKNRTDALIIGWYFRAFISMLILIITGNR